MMRIVHRTVKRVTADYERFKFNVAISKLMTLTNELQRAVESGADREAVRMTAERLVLMLAPMAPFIAEELWRGPLGHEQSVHRSPWPSYDEELARDEQVVMVVQVNGKVRDRILVDSHADQEECERIALASERVRPFLEMASPSRLISRPPKLVNIVC